MCSAIGTSKLEYLFLIASHRIITLTSAQPLGSCSLVLSHMHAQLNRSLSHCVTQENHLEYHIISTLCIEETNTSFHLCLRTIHPTHGLPHIGAQNIPSLSQRGTTHPAHGLPYTRAHYIPSPSYKGTTHPSHGHTQLMGSLTSRLTQSVS